MLIWSSLNVYFVSVQFKYRLFLVLRALVHPHLNFHESNPLILYNSFQELSNPIKIVRVYFICIF